MVTKGFKKKKSKRISSKTTRKVDKKVKEHNRKQKKEARKNPKSKKGLKKDPGVPNSLPFKNEILAEIAEKKRKDFEIKKKKKLQKKLNANKRTLENVVGDAQKRADEFKHQEELVKEDQNLNGLYDNSLKAYYREVKKVIEGADVILEILDARDPMGTRCRQLEDNILQSGSGKRLVLVINKCDLIPKENLQLWLKYLRNEFPTIAFKASTQTQKSNLSHSRVPICSAKPDLIKTSACFGANLLMKILGNYCRNKGITTSIRVGVVGLPNVGKSSIINSLKRKQTCNVGSTPGVTKAVQEIHLDKHITLMDSPGVLFTKSEDDGLAALRNAIRIDTLPDPVAPVEFILKKCDPTQLMVHYKIPKFADSDVFLALVAKKRGLLKKGGIPDILKAARFVLQDWVSGKISYYTQPPQSTPENVHLSAALVTTMSKEFDLDAMELDDKMLIDELPETEIWRASAVDMDGDMAEKNDNEIGLPKAIVSLTNKAATEDDSDDDWQSEGSEEMLEGNQQSNKMRKKLIRKRLKLKRKRSKIANSMADEIDSLLTLSTGSAEKMQE